MFANYNFVAISIVYFTRLVRRFIKSIKTNCVKLFGLAKYALPHIIMGILMYKKCHQPDFLLLSKRKFPSVDKLL